uniref:Uncharacterized protein n=2 Tax=viral metagenome TaxID=1070528 RepID=A0A6M3Y3W2_9ZZZZ
MEANMTGVRKHPELFEKAIKDAQVLADLYHAPYYVARGRFNYWTVSPVKGVLEVLPTDKKISQDIPLVSG